jgi:DNA polymerase-4
VGASTATYLEHAYIRTIGELAQMNPERLVAMFGNKMGNHLHRYANGIDESPVAEEPEDAKGYSVSTTLARDIVSLEEASPILLALTDSVASRMRADGVKAYCIAVTIRSNRFKDRSHQRKLREPTDITDDIFRNVLSLFEALWDGKTPLRLLGVALSEVSREGEAQQLTFFSESEDKSKARKVDKTVDEIRKRFGYDTIKRASVCNSGEDVGKKYKAKLENQK